MNIFKRLFIPNGEKEEITAFESWTVRWESRRGRYSSNTQEECEVFVSKDGAEKFAEQLREAFKLLKHSGGGTYVKISKN